MTRTPEDNERIVKSGFKDKARKTLGKVPFTRDAVAGYFCAVDPATPKRVKAILMGALAYFVMPIDAIPDIIAMLGFTDDAAVFWLAWRSISGHINDRHRAQADAFFGNQENDSATGDPDR